MTDVVDLAAALHRVEGLWSPHRVARLNDYDVKVVRVDGDFPEHAHADTDELFLVLTGCLTLRLPDRTLELGPGQLAVVPAGVRHAPSAAPGTQMVLLEPAGVVNTGDAGGPRTAPVRDLD